jgi:hypothetical protein
VIPIKDDYTVPGSSGNEGGYNLVSSVKQGDQEAIARLYDQYSAVLFGFISRIIDNPVLAEGVLQNSFIVIWKSMAMFDPEKERLLTWMLKITMSISINALPDSGIISNGETGLSNHQYLNNAISLVFFKGLTLEDAAKKLEIPLEVLIPKMKMAFKQLHGGLSV